MYKYLLYTRNGESSKLQTSKNFISKRNKINVNIFKRTLKVTKNILHVKLQRPNEDQSDIFKLSYKLLLYVILSYSELEI